MPSNRRQFLVTTAMLSASLSLPRVALSDDAMVSESDSNAQALGYRADATTVDKAKYPKYASGQMCSTCQFYQGAAADPTAPCPLFGTKRVSGKGWCNSYIKKAA
ncbi:High-potential iron-sulfur protein [Pararobbsia alpina]|uniref:high-potential iron-sulfur protein n=1 Tax=Pararobbsia alpina TaxID=621374 RepID=UPI0039A4B8C6